VCMLLCLCVCVFSFCAPPRAGTTPGNARDLHAPPKDVGDGKGGGAEEERARAAVAGPARGAERGKKI